MLDHINCPDGLSQSDLSNIIEEFKAQVEQDMQDIIDGFDDDIADITDEITDDSVSETVTGSEPTPEDKNWLFEENVRLQEVERRLEEEQARLDKYAAELEEKAKLIEEMNEKFIKERAQFRDEMNVLTGQVTRERQRLKQDEQFFDKKMEILKAGFADLDKAKRELEAEKMRYEAQTSYYGDDDIPGYCAPIARRLFGEITNPLMLKKRYKDLVKIYHPDNLAGDHDLFKAITIEYERLQGKLSSFNKSASQT